MKNKKMIKKVAAFLLAFSLVVPAAGAVRTYAASVTETAVATDVKKAETKEKLKELKEKGKITEAALNEFVKEAEDADTVDVLEDILAEAGYFDEETTGKDDPDNNEGAVSDPIRRQKDETIEKLKGLKEKGRLTEAALNEFVKEAEDADTVAVLEDILAEAGFFDKPETESEKETETESEKETETESEKETETESEKETETESENEDGIVDKDTDGDGYSDVVERNLGSDPYDPKSTPKFGDAGTGEGQDRDTKDEDNEDSSGEDKGETKPGKEDGSKDDTKPGKGNDSKGDDNNKGSSTKKNPSTGDMGIALSAATLLTSAGAYVFTSRKKEDK